MIILILLFTLFYSFNTAQYNIIFNRIENTFNSLITELPNTWIRYLIIEEKEQPFYKISAIKESCFNYFKNNLVNYISSFKLSYYYFDPVSKEEIKESEYTQGVKVGFSC